MTTQVDSKIVEWDRQRQRKLSTSTPCLLNTSIYPLLNCAFPYSCTPYDILAASALQDSATALAAASPASQPQIPRSAMIGQATCTPIDINSRLRCVIEAHVQEIFVSSLSLAVDERNMKEKTEKYIHVIAKDSWSARMVLLDYVQ